jgi:hypothetical protein
MNSSTNSNEVACQAAHLEALDEQLSVVPDDPNRMCLLIPFFV